MTDPRIDAERLAALLDGRTNSARRAAILDEVAKSEDAAAVLADAAAVLREVEASDAGAAAIEAPRATSTIESPHRGRAQRSWLRGPRLPWVAAAAAVLLVVLVPLLRTRPTTAELGPAAAFAIPLASESRREADAVRAHEWSTTRSGTIVLSPNARAARLGVRLAELELTAERGDSVASRLARDIALLMADIDGGAPATAYYRMVADSVAGSRADPRPLLRRGRDAVLTAVGPGADDVLALAAWAEFGRAAASAGDIGFLRDRRGLALLGRAKPALAGDEAALEAVQHLEDQLSSGPPSERTTLVGAFDALLRALTR